MQLSDLKKMPVLQTKGINAAAAGDPETNNYILDCLFRFYGGDYGEICEDDTAANNADLEAGEGHILARYKGKYNLERDFYIEAHFYEPKLNDIDYTNILIMFPDER